MKREDIEKAARKQLKGIVPCEWNQRSFVDIFVDAAEWRINSVWHDTSEKPDKGKLLIVEDIDSAYDLVYLTKSKPWEELSEKNHYMRWAYIEDLLPNMED
jgi:hypothetical protein